MSHDDGTEVLIASLIGDLYATLDDPSSWPSYLERLQGQLGAQYALWYTTSVSDPLVGSAYGTADRHEGFMEQHLLRGGNLLNPSLALAARGYFRDAMVSELRYLDRASPVFSPEYVKEVLSHSGLRSCLGVTALAQGPDHTVFSVYYEDHDGYDSRDLMMLGRLAPHMHRAARSHSSLHAARKQLAVLVAEVEVAGGCVLGLDAKGRPTFLSPNVERVSRELASILSLRARRLELVCAQTRLAVNVRLRTLAARQSVFERTPLRSDDRLEATLELHALRGALQGALPSSTVAIAILQSRRLGALARAEALGRRYSLSDAEVHVLSGLLDGHTVEAISRTRCSSPHTVRHQIESLLGKLGVTSREGIHGLATRAR